MKVCAYCGGENSDEAVHCSKCGTDNFKTTAPADIPEETPVSKLEFLPLAPDEKGNDLVSLMRCRTLLEADMIVAQLDSAGIGAFIPDQFLMQAVAFNLNAYGYVRVQVSPNDYEAAKEFLLASQAP